MVECFVGSYLSDNGAGIYRFEFNPCNNSISSVELFSPALDSKYIHIEDNEIFTISKGSTQYGVNVYHKDGNLISSIEYEDSASCYLIKHFDHVFTVNYHEGTITKLSFHEKSLKIESKAIIQVKAGCHQVIILENSLLVPCLLLDKVYILDFNLNIIGEFTLPPHSGPRHGIISSDKKYLYLLGELDDCLYTFSIQNTHFILKDKISLLPNDTPVGQSAALRMSKDGKMLIASTRGINQITFIDISGGLPIVKSRQSSGGDHPRDILNILDDKFLLVAHKTSGNIIVFKVNQNNILEKVVEASIKGAVSIGIIGAQL
ncbi:MAG: lactonase family protein [Brevinema sp.]